MDTLARFPVIADYIMPIKFSRPMYPPMTSMAKIAIRAKLSNLLTACSSFSSMWVVSPLHLTNLQYFYSNQRIESFVVVILAIMLKLTFHKAERHIYDYRPRYCTQLDGNSA